MNPFTLGKYRRFGKGPPYIQVGRRYFYRAEAIRAWLLAKERSPDGAPTVPSEVRPVIRRGRPRVRT